VKSSLIGGPSTWTVDCTDGSTYGDLLIPQWRSRWRSSPVKLERAAADGGGSAMAA
jgi:hypothetical protein